ncbi:MAG: hypothetical protein AB7N70_16125 [Dehalococcoidia bacterium]
MKSEPPPPPLAVELSRPVLLACRHQPDLTRSINSILLRAARRLRARGEVEQRVRVAGRIEGIVLDLRLLPPDRCRVEAVEHDPIDTAPDLTV